jgi:hypothetical protein
MTSQIRRSAASIAANIAEGRGENAAFDDQEPATEIMKAIFLYSLFPIRYSLSIEAS